MDKRNTKIGFIGQGWIGKNYADDMEQRGFDVTRYAKEAPYENNKDTIRECDIVFIAVPTPTTPKGFDASILSGVLSLVGKGKIAVIKSTTLMGTVRKLQAENPTITIVNSPEFLCINTAAYDASHPSRNIIGLVERTEDNLKIAELILSVLPKAPHTLLCSYEEAELIKYSHNINGYFQIILSNILYDATQKLGADWSVLKEAFEHDPMMSSTYLNPIHKCGRGAGGACFIKDFEAFIEFFQNDVRDKKGIEVLKALRDKNIELLRTSGKDTDLLDGVYGKKP